MHERKDTNQHYVSQFLLRGFDTGSGAQVYVFDKQTRRVFTSAISKVASAEGFYNIRESSALDDAMSRAENSVAPVIEKIRQCKSLAALDTNEWATLVGFTSLQLVRTKAYSQRTTAMWKQLAAAIAERSGGELTESIRQQLGFSSPLSDHEQVLQTIPGLVPTSAQELAKKSLLLFRTDGSLPFWISDNPAVMNNTLNDGDGGLRGNLGLGVQGIEVYLPISSELTLAFMCPSIATAYNVLYECAARMGFIHEVARAYLTSMETGQAMVLTREQIRFQNSLQVANAERFVYGPTADFADAHELLQQNPSTRTGPRYSGP